ncbi:plastoglobulin-1, chloroplastic-like protein [Tanacetum coccineum]
MSSTDIMRYGRSCLHGPGAKREWKTIMVGAQLNKINYRARLLKIHQFIGLVFFSVNASNGSTGVGVVEDGDGRVEELKRCLVDSVYGTGLGFNASPEERGEVLELVNQLEAVNPTKAPTDAVELLDGNWILL